MDDNPYEAIVEHFKNTGEILLCSEIVEGVTENIFREIFRKNKGKKVKLIVDCEGGSLISTNIILNWMRFYRIQADAIIVGKAQSSGLIIVEYCRRRSAFPGTSFNVHFGKLEINNSLIHRLYHPDDFPLFPADEEIRSLYRTHINKILERTKISEAVLDQMMLTEVEFNEKKALELGFIDEIIT